MKKILSAVLCFGVLSGCFVPAFAADTAEAEKAMAVVKERLKIDDSFENFEFSTDTDTNGDIAYYFDWKAKNSDGAYDHVCVTYKNGIITDYNDTRNRNVHQGTLFYKYDISDAYLAAQSFLEQINPENYEDFSVIQDDRNSLSNSECYFTVVRKENDIPVIGNNGFISVDKETNNVRYFYINYDFALDFADANNVISLDEAKNAYIEKLAPKLYYSAHYDYSEQEKHIFAKYSPEDTDKVINANDGSVYILPGSIYRADGAMGGNKNEATADMSGFTEAEIAEINKHSNLISKEEAENTARKNEVLAMPKAAELKNIFLTRRFDDKEEFTYSMRFEVGENSYVSVSVNAKNGEILSFTKKGNYDENKKPSFEKEKALAEEALKKLAPEKYGSFKLNNEEIIGQVTYHRVADGIEFLDNGAEFYFDSNEEIVGYSLMYDENAAFPSVENVIDEKTAAQFILDYFNFGLAYYPDYETNTCELIYTVLNDSGENYLGYSVNPADGTPLNPDGSPYEETANIFYSDIKNHYAKDKFEKLAKYGIGFEGGTLNPEKNITVGEYEKLLSLVFYGSDDLVSLWEYGGKEEILDTDCITREKAAFYLVSLMGGEEYLKHDEMFKDPFADVTENKGTVAYLKALGVINGDDKGNFNPKKEITRGEALIILYNFLNR